MNFPRPVVSLFRLAALLAGNTLIAAFLTLIGFGGTFGENLLYAQCIGLSIAALARPAWRYAGPWRALILPLALLLAAGGGFLIAHSLSGSLKPLQESLLLPSLLTGLFFGAIGTLIFSLRERAARLDLALRDGEMRRLQAEKRSVEAQLRLLQAQIEPHFLFNTLANLAGLIETDPPLAGRLLAALNRYLRDSLTQARAEAGTLGDEIDLIAAYLDVLKIRFGPRLEVLVELDPALRSLPFPPMLLQPLVENAIEHGIAPLVNGGRLTLSAHRAGTTLHLAVSDNGRGLAAAPAAGCAGVGLANVRERLHALYGNAGRLEIASATNGGVVATITIPLPEAPS